MYNTQIFEQALTIIFKYNKRRWKAVHNNNCNNDENKNGKQEKKCFEFEYKNHFAYKNRDEKVFRQLDVLSIYE